MLLRRYILREYLRFVAATVMLCLFLFILFDFIHKATSYFQKYDPSVSLITQFYIYQVPFQLVQILPIAALLSSVVSMVVLNRHNETTAMRAAGMSPSQIAIPLGIGGFGLCIFSFFLNEIIR